MLLLPTRFLRSWAPVMGISSRCVSGITTIAASLPESTGHGINKPGKLNQDVASATPASSSSSSSTTTFQDHQHRNICPTTAVGDRDDRDADDVEMDRNEDDRVDDGADVGNMMKRTATRDLIPQDPFGPA